MALYTTYRVANGQSAIDFCMQYYGCYEGIVQLMADNPGTVSSPTSYLAPGTPLRVLTTVPQFNDTNQAVLAKFSSPPVTQVATGAGEEITAYIAGLGTIGFTNLGGDNWEYNFYNALSSLQAFPSTTSAATYDYQVIFWAGGVSTLIANGTSTTNYSGSTSGNGAGVYEITAGYATADGRHITISSLYLVNGSGTILASVVVDGSVISNVSGTILTETPAVTFFNCSYGVNWLFLDSSFTLISISSTSINMALPVNTEYLVMYIGLDSLFIDRHSPDYTPYFSEVTIS